MRRTCRQVSGRGPRPRARSHRGVSPRAEGDRDEHPGSPDRAGGRSPPAAADATFTGSAPARTVCAAMRSSGERRGATPREHRWRVRDAVWGKSPDERGVGDSWDMSATTPLDPRARRALESICDTFAPGGAGLPSATELGVPDALLELVVAQPAGVGAKAGRTAARLLGHASAHRRGWGRAAPLLRPLPGSAREGAPVMGGQPRDLAPRRVPGASQGHAAGLLRHGRRQPGAGGDGLPGPLGPPADPPAPGSSR